MKAEFAKYTLLKLYTDTVPTRYYPSAADADQREADAAAHKAFQLKHFNTNELPLYAVMEPTETGAKEIARYSVGLIRDKAEFLKFLRDHSQ